MAYFTDELAEEIRLECEAAITEGRSLMSVLAALAEVITYLLEYFGER